MGVGGQEPTKDRSNSNCFFNDMPWKAVDSTIPYSYPQNMEVQLTPDQQAFAQQAIKTGRLHHEDEAVREALALWESRERTRSEILAMVDSAETSLAQGAGRMITEQSMIELANEVKQRGRARFSDEQVARS